MAETIDLSDAAGTTVFVNINANTARTERVTFTAGQFKKVVQGTGENNTRLEGFTVVPGSNSFPATSMTVEADSTEDGGATFQRSNTIQERHGFAGPTTTIIVGIDDTDAGGNSDKDFNDLIVSFMFFNFRFASDRLAELGSKT